MIAVTVCLVVLVAQPAPTPRDELLRLAPRDAAILFLLQNGRDHFQNVSRSPFVEWFPSTSIGKRVLDSAELKQLRESAGAILRELDSNPQTLIDDVVGDAVAFAFSPAPTDRPTDERAIILVRPRKTETLEKLLGKLNDLQTKSGELKAVRRKEHAGGAYFERQKGEAASEFYCFRGSVFAFSTTEAEIKAFIDRDIAEAPPAEKIPELTARLNRLGIAGAAGVVLINPRPLDAEVKARVAAAKPDEKRFLERFAEIWTALDTAAVFVTLDRDVELGVSFRFQPGKLRPDSKKWLTGADRPIAKWLIPDNALFGVTGHIRAAELIDFVLSVTPVEAGKPGIKEWITQTLGPVVGRDKLPLVLDALGPDWAIWAEQPVKDSYLPTLVGVIEISGEGEARLKTQKTIVESVEDGFRLARLAYNAKHSDQIELKEEKDVETGVVIKTLVNEKGFPPGFRPSFAVVNGYLVLATSPDAIRRFTGFPTRGSTAIATFSGTRTREYLLEHGPKLAKFLSDLGVVGDEAKTRETLETVATMLELIDKLYIDTDYNANGLRITVRVKPTKPLKK